MFKCLKCNFYKDLTVLNSIIYRGLQLSDVEKVRHKHKKKNLNNNISLLSCRFKYSV